MSGRDARGRFTKGHVPWNKGLKNCFSQETLERAVKKRRQYYKQHGHPRKGKTYEEIYGEERAKVIKQKISEKHKNRKLSEEHKRKISEGLKRFYQNHPEVRKYLSELCTAKKAWITRKERYGKLGVRDPEKFYEVRKRYFIGCRKGKKHSPEARQKMSLARKGKTYEEIYGKEMAERLRKMSSIRRSKFLRENPEYIFKFLDASRRARISKPQKLLYELIKQIFPEAQMEYRIKTKNTFRFADIAIPSLKIDIEFDGEYWHDKEYDRLRDLELQEVGWRTIRICLLYTSPSPRDRG